MVAGGVDPPGRLADRRARWPETGDPALLDRRVGGAGGDPRRQVAGQGVDEDRGRRRAASPGRPTRSTGLQAVESDLRAVGRITGEVTWTEAEGPVTVDVTLAPTS